MDIKILIATHKAYRMPEDDMYMPIHVGRDGKENDFGYFADNTGENISSKNKNYCELTGIYWAWKNLKADYIGLAHYRRHFATKKRRDKWESVLKFEEAQRLLKEHDVILPNKRKYYIETNYSHYIHAHEKEGLDMVIDIIKKDYPEYSKSCDLVMNRTWAHMFNMFIMKKDLFHKYCEWLFDILFKVEQRLDISKYSPSEARVFGYLSELMLDVWVEGNGIGYGECPVVFMERQNWVKKVGVFFWRKIKN